MTVSRRTFTLGSVAGFLASARRGDAQTEPADPELPVCEDITRDANGWHSVASLRYADPPPHRQSITLTTDKKIQLFRNADRKWDNLTGDASLRLSWVSGSGNDTVTLSFRINTSVMLDDRTQVESLPFPLGLTELKGPVQYLVDVASGGDKTTIVNETRESTFRKDTSEHSFRVDLPPTFLNRKDTQLFLGFWFGTTYAIGAVIDQSDLHPAATQAIADATMLSASAARGECRVKRPTAGCFVVTAAAQARQELGADPLDLDQMLIARDRLLDSLPQYIPAADHYYATSPELVQRIRTSNHRHDILDRFVRRYVIPADWLIRHGLHKIGFVVLGLGIEGLYRRHMPDIPPPSAFAPGRSPSEPDAF